jgi:hypothetical protein
MRLQPLYDLQQEINRLFIAGSKFAKGDPRLQKHIPVLQKLGEKAPVFNKLAADIDDLLKADTQESSGKLTAISTLLYSVLYTQGETTEADTAEHEQSPNINIEDVRTAYSYLQLKPVMQALTTSDSGRLDVLRDALERNVFNDSRIYKYLDAALADKYSELAAYVEETVIPAIGAPVVPFLLQNFKYEDKPEQARRLRLLAKFKAELMPAMTEQILAGSMPILQAEVIHILSNDPKNEALIIKMADDKNKLVREAAYKALAKLNTQAGLEKLTEAYLKNKTKGNLSLIVSALALTKLPFFFQEVFGQISASFDDFIALTKDADEKVLTEKLNLFETHLTALQNKEPKQVCPFLSNILQNKAYHQLIAAKKTLLGSTANAIVVRIADILDSFDLAGKLAFYEEHIGKIPDGDGKNTVWNRYFFTAIAANYTPKKVFDVFGGLFKKKIIDIDDLYCAYSNMDTLNIYAFNENVVIYADKMDARWIDLLYESLTGKHRWDYNHDKALLILNVYEKKSKKLDQLLVSLAQNGQLADNAFIFKLLLEREVANRFEIIYTAMSKATKNTYYWTLNRLKNNCVWNTFPKEYEAKFRKLYDRTQLELFSDIADEIAAG